MVEMVGCPVIKGEAGKAGAAASEAGLAGFSRATSFKAAMVALVLGTVEDCN